MFRWGLVALATCLLAGCATTDPGRGADITYFLPRTDASAGLTLNLTRCDPIAVDAVATIAGEAGADRAVHVDSTKLMSGRIERELKITTGDDLVISGVNAQATDQTATIIGNGLKVVAAIAPAVADAKGLVARSPGHCLPDVAAALGRVDQLKLEITALRSKLAGPFSAVDPRDVRDLNSRIKELAGLQTNLLQVTTTQSLDLGDNKAGPWGGVVAFKPKDFEKWFGDAATKDLVDNQFALFWSAKRSAGPVIMGLKGAGQRTLRPCGLSLLVPAASTVDFVVHGHGDDDGPQGMALRKVKHETSLPLAQINDPAELCIDAGFGEKRGVEVGFDKFGRTTSLDWTSQATAANVTGAIAGYLPDLKTITTRPKGAAAPSAIDQQKSEIDRLKTLQDYNELKACEAVLAAGGYDCKATPQ